MWRMILIIRSVLERRADTPPASPTSPSPIAREPRTSGAEVAGEELRDFDFRGGSDRLHPRNIHGCHDVGAVPPVLGNWDPMGPAHAHPFFLH